MAAHTWTSRRRWVLVVSVGLLVVLGVLSAGFAQEGPRGTGRVCQAPYDSEFDDIAGSVHAEVIRCLADHGITQGRADGSYGPRVGVRRDQMASFVARFLEAAHGEPLEAGDARFEDVAAESPHAEAINRLATAGVVEGTGDGRYEPGGVVARDAMASFIRRAIAYLDDGQATYGSQPRDGSEGTFSDVPPDNVHADNIVALAGPGIVAGFDDGTYRPRESVTRGQMAAFVMRGYDYADQQALTAGRAESEDDQDSDTSGDGGTGDSDDGAGDDTGDGDADGGSGDGDTGEGEGEPASLAGTVTDGESQDPIAGATVAVEEIAGATATTGDQGGYTIDEVPAGEHTVTASAEGYEQASRQVSLEDGERREGVDFTLAPASGGEPDDQPGTITGTVSDTDGQPLAAATVTVEEVEGATATTDGDGSYTIDDVPAGERTVTATADGHDSESRQVEVQPGQTTSGVDFTLAPQPGAITGTVSDTDGDPLADATVTVEGVAGATAASGGDGSYSIGDVPAGEHTVTAEADGHDPQSRQAEVQPGQPTSGIDFALAPQPGTITGTVTDTDGQPMAAATVTVEEVEGATTTTDGDGGYTIDDLPPGEHHTVTGEADNHYPHTVSEIAVAPGGTSQADLDLLVVESYPCSASDEACALPDDGQFGQQWGLYNTGQQVDDTSGTTGADISAPWAWQTTTGSREVVVGVLDSGIEDDHPDLEANMWHNPGVNGCDEGTHGYRVMLDDCNPSAGSHGTSVAGVIGAVGNNDEGMAGVAWQTSLMDLQVDETSLGGGGSTIAKGVDWAIQARRDHGVNVRVLNLSAGGDFSSDTLRSKIEEAGKEGILFVTSAGNSARDVDEEPSYPCSFDLPNLICVAGSNQDDGLWSRSNWGAGSVDLAAPADNIRTTTTWGSHTTASGTSVAAPFVSGVAALLWSQQPDLTVEEVRARIVDNVDVLDSLEGRVASGGRLNAYRALNAPSSSSEGDGGTVSSSSQGTDDGSGGDDELAASSKGPAVSGDGLVWAAGTGQAGATDCGQGDGGRSSRPLGGTCLPQRAWWRGRLPG